MANPEHVERLKLSVKEWNEWRQEHPEIRPDFSDAKLDNTYLHTANLSSANLIKANLRGANLCDANLTRSDLYKASLYEANLGHTNLSFANLVRAKLGSADLSRAKLHRADLSNANLNSTDLTKARFYYTIFAKVDLSTVNGLDTVRHEGPSTVNINSVILPRDKHTRLHFLRGVGFSDDFINYLPSLLATANQYHSLFISHSHHNQTFAKRLHADLQNQGVRCWFAPHDLRPGTPIVRGIEEAIHLHEKLLLILSKDAVMSNWVQQEVEAALYKEATTRQEILFPIRLDNTILESETLWAQRLRTRHIGDFTNWQDDADYQQAFTALLRHLKVDRPPTTLS
jgi:uncharacterized protein YjbI with pentapeptide repeats